MKRPELLAVLAVLALIALYLATADVWRLENEAGWPIYFRSP